MPGVLRRTRTAPVSVGQILALSTKPQSTDLVQPKGTICHLRDAPAELLPHTFLPASKNILPFPPKPPKRAFAEMQWWPACMSHPRDVLQRARKAQVLSPSLLIQSPATRGCSPAWQSFSPSKMQGKTRTFHCKTKGATPGTGGKS